MEFPYSGWVLMPSMKPVEVTFVKEYKSVFHDIYHETAKSKLHHVESIYQSKEAAVENGFAKLKKQQDSVDKMQLNINKRRAVLEKYRD